MQSFQDQRETLKSVATALKASGVPFALAGGYAVWARGGPESTHDVDVVVPRDAADAAHKVLMPVLSGGVPVRNVAQPVIRSAYRIYDVVPGGGR